jgi:hypothetical protein
VHPKEKNVRDTIVKLRVSERLKSEWFAYADQVGIPLSDLIRTACRLSILVGHSRLAAGLSDIADIRRDLHAIGAALRQIANDNPKVGSDEVQSALASVHVATEAIAASINPGGHK